MENKKAFFEGRTVAEIRDLKSIRVYNQRDLVERIDCLHEDESLILGFQIIPGRFYRNNSGGSEAARRFWKKGPILYLPQPETAEEALASNEIPLNLRRKAIDELTERLRAGKLRQQDISLYGYSFHPVSGDERLRRVVPFCVPPEATKIFAYAETMTEGVNVRPYSRFSKEQGATVVVDVPSRTKGRPREEFGFVHVPFLRDKHNLANSLSIRPESISTDQATSQPDELHKISYSVREGDKEHVEEIHFFPRHVAAYLGIVRDQWKEATNFRVPPIALIFNPFIFPSKHQADFYQKLEQNLLVYDPSLASKQMLRKPNLAEKSIILGRASVVFGHEDFCFWDSTRDGKIKAYVWN